MSYERYSSKYLRFDTTINLTHDMIKSFINSEKIEDFIVVKGAGNTILCYATRKNGLIFNYKKGAKTLSKKLGCNPDNLTMIPIRKGQHMPEDFFKQLIDLDKIDDQIQYIYGRFTKEMIKAKISQSVKQSQNKQIISAVMSGGTSSCVKEGIITPGQALTMDKWKTGEDEKKDKEVRKERDLERGDTMKLYCHITGKKYTIESFKGDGLQDEPEQRVFDVNEITGKRELKLYESNIDPFQKRKHYYFYSKNGGYGKTTFKNRVCKLANGCIITDLKNLSGVSEHAQFLFVDEYGPERRFKFEELKGLTSGDTEGFTGNKKTYGDSYHARKDAQLIILSNNHLFDAMGTYNPIYKRRMLNKSKVDVLKQRFFIYRLDETDESTEATDAAYHTYDENNKVHKRKRNDGGFIYKKRRRTESESTEATVYDDTGYSDNDDEEEEYPKDIRLC